MSSGVSLSRMFVLLCTPEPRFLLPGSCAVIVGTSIAYAAQGSINWLLAAVAAVSIVLLNAGSNMINDYYDHLSGNDWLNENDTPFSGGSRYIQNKIVTPKAMLIAGLSALTLGSATGILIVVLSKSMAILCLGIAGVLGGFFWTAPPVKICYRFIGEPYIFLMFGLLPVSGAYYLQTRQFDVEPLLVSICSGLLISMVALINSIPDRFADEKVDKQTFVVRYGLKKAVVFYRSSILAVYILAAALLFMPGVMRGAAAGLLCTLPLGLFAIKTANVRVLSKPRESLPNRLTIMLFVAGSIGISAGGIISQAI